MLFCVNVCGGWGNSVRVQIEWERQPLCLEGMPLKLCSCTLIGYKVLFYLQIVSARAIEGKYFVYSKTWDVCKIQSYH